MKIQASDVAHDALSENGAGTNNAFGTATIGSKAYIEIAPPVSYEHAAFTLKGRSDENPLGEAAVGLCLTENGEYSPGDTGLAIGAFSALVGVWCQALAPCTHPGILNDYAGFTLIVGETAEGVAGSDSAASGQSTEIEQAAGSAGATSAAQAATTEVESGSGVSAADSAAEAAATEIETAAGVAGSDSEATGWADGQGEAEGVAASASGASGEAVEVELIDGVAGSASGASGSAEAVPVPEATGVAGSGSGASAATSEVEPVAGLAASGSAAAGVATSYHLNANYTFEPTWAGHGTLGAGAGSDRYIGSQIFTATATGNLGKLLLPIHWALGDGNNLTIAIYSDSSGSPGTLLGSTTLAGFTTPDADMASSAWPVVIFATPVAITNGTSYHIVITVSAGTGRYLWGHQGTGTPVGKYKLNDGAWTNFSGRLGFAIYTVT